MADRYLLFGTFEGIISCDLLRHDGRSELMGKSTHPRPLLTQKEEATCQAYAFDSSNKSAAYRIGYPKSKKWKIGSVNVAACGFFQKPKIQLRMSELEAITVKVASEKFAIDAEYILNRLAEVDRMDISDILTDDDTLLPVSDWPKVWRQFISSFDVEDIFAGRGDARLHIGLLKKLKWPDKIRNLELLGKHVNVNAFKEVREHSGPGGGPIQLITTEMTAQEAAEAYAGTLKN